mmetsp:Transcript_4639/g.7954  ORF Transcript_4639/g.7954 Transcript_4639/m.7954 type:complete len:87 (-) Transcript_4639:95-355(-)
MQREGSGSRHWDSQNCGCCISLSSTTAFAVDKCHGFDCCFHFAHKYIFTLHDSKNATIMSKAMTESTLTSNSNRNPPANRSMSFFG